MEKSSGNDDIATEMIKALNDEGIKKITELCNLVYDRGYLPPDMSSSIFVTLGPFFFDYLVYGSADLIFNPLNPE